MHRVRGIGVRPAQKNVPAFKRCRNAIFQKRTMPDESLKTKPERLPKTSIR